MCVTSTGTMHTCTLYLHSSSCRCLHSLLPLQWHSEVLELLLFQEWNSLLLLPARRVRELLQHPAMWSFSQRSREVDPYSYLINAFFEGFVGWFTPLCLPREGPAPSASPAALDSSFSSPTLPSLPVIFQFHVPTLQHVPKGARDCWAHTLSDCLSSVVSFLRNFPSGSASLCWPSACWPALLPDIVCIGVRFGNG